MQIVSHAANEMVINSIPGIDKNMISCSQRLSYIYTKIIHAAQLFRDGTFLKNQKALINWTESVTTFMHESLHGAKFCDSSPYMIKPRLQKWLSLLGQATERAFCHRIEL